MSKISHATSEAGHGAGWTPLLLAAAVAIALALLVLPSLPPFVPPPPTNDTLLASFGPDFVFGVATAPAHVEDQLNDTWLQWALDGNIPRWSEAPFPQVRVLFWSQPEVDIDLAQSTGVSLFRMGVDWGRLTPHMPGARFCNKRGLVGGRADDDRSFPCRDGIQDNDALARYLRIMHMVRQRGMQVSLTLFHYSLPRWAGSKEFRGWVNPATTEHFLAFVRDLIPYTASLVDHYVTLNEPAVFGNLVYGLCMWPGRLNDQPILWEAYWNLPFVQGTVIMAYSQMAQAHIGAYNIIKQLDTVRGHPASAAPAMTGIAHNVAWYQGNWIAGPIAAFMDYLMNLEFMYRIMHSIDYIGMNYYGTELVAVTGISIDSAREYSESGRAVSPDGLFLLLDDFHKRFNVELNRTLPIYIMENGISDSTDILRPSYIIEHLLAVQKAIDHGIPVKAFVFWTISDNWEWADGYCPHFGLFAVDRSLPDMPRSARPSVDLIRHITGNRTISHKQRMSAFNLVRRNLYKERPFCRKDDGQTTVNADTYRPIKWHDWLVDYRAELVPERPWWEWIIPTLI